MQIHSIGSPLPLKLDERATAAATEPAAAPGRQERPEAAGVPPSREEVTAAVKKLNEAIPASSQSLEFAIDDDSKEIVVKIIDQSTKEVVRQIPTEEALQIAKSIDRMQGLLIRQTA